MNTAQLQLDYPVWRLSWSAYGEQKGYDLSQTESATDWFDHQLAPDEERDAYINDSGGGSVEDIEPPVCDGEDAEEWQRRSERECDYTEITQ